MKNRTVRTFVSVAGIAAGVAAVQPADAATILPGDALNVAGLSIGESFQLVFVTDRNNRISPDALDGTVDNTDNTVIGDWNSHVNTVAGLSSQAGIPGLSWSAIISTRDLSAGSTDPGVAAKDNAPALADVYRLDGGLVATEANFYTSTHLLPINIEQSGNTINTAGGSGSGRLVWSGSRSDGTIDPRPLGNPGSNTGNFGSRTGNAPATNDDWLNRSDAERRGPTTSLRVYALSEEITIIPEPGTLALIAIGGAMVARRRRG